MSGRAIPEPKPKKKINQRAKPETDRLFAEIRMNWPLKARRQLRKGRAEIRQLEVRPQNTGRPSSFSIAPLRLIANPSKLCRPTAYSILSAASMKSMANPAPLGLFGFALTTFVLSCYNAGVFGVHATDPIHVAIGLAVFYGGIAQALAGMWAFPYGDAFAATAFSSYGAFWLSFGALIIPWFGISDGYLHSPSTVVSNAKATYLLGWTIFTFIMLVASARTSVALCVLFCFVEMTFILLTTAEFRESESLHKAAGFMGIITAAIAWYNALAVLLESQENPLLSLPIGKRDERIQKDLTRNSVMELGSGESRHKNRICCGSEQV